MRELAESFALDRYATWPGLLSEKDRAFFYAYACSRVARMYLDDPAVPGTPSLGGDPVMDQLLLEIIPKLEGAIGVSLYPTYSYFRLYKRGDVLHRHTDRPACEISLSLCLGCEPDAPWPIWVQAPDRPAVGIDLRPGDAVLYRGIECAHWREAYQGDRLAQVFLHYVDKNGPHADWKYDKGPVITRA